LKISSSRDSSVPISTVRVLIVFGMSALFRPLTSHDVELVCIGPNLEIAGRRTEGSQVIFRFNFRRPLKSLRRMFLARPGPFLGVLLQVREFFIRASIPDLDPAVCGSRKR